MSFLKKRPRPQIALYSHGARSSSWPLGLALFVLALIPRAATLGNFVTVDEAYYWFGRANRFLQAMLSGRYGATNQVGHPGVTTMWLGAAGIEIQHGLERLGLLHDADAALARALMRLPVAATASLCLALAYPLLVRLLGRRIALLAALLWASEPFLVAHSQLLHVDALLTSFSTLALLAALLAFRFDADPGDLADRAPRWGYLAASGLGGGLALLTKSPALILLPMVGLIALVAAWRSAASAQARPFRHILRRFWGAIALPALAWVAVAVVVWVALWPAMWVDPAHALSKVLPPGRRRRRLAARLGQLLPGPRGGRSWAAVLPGRARISARAMDADWADRSSVHAFWISVFGSRIKQRRDQQTTIHEPTSPRPGSAGGVRAPIHSHDEHPAQKVRPLRAADRAGAGYSGGGGAARNCRLQIADCRLDAQEICNLQSAILWAVVVFGLVANLAWFHPYEIAYYNQLLGGGRVAARFIPIGWGEGYEQVGSFLRAQPDGASKPVATWFEPVLRTFVRGSVVPLSRALTPGRVGYVVLYIDQIQRQDVPEAIAQYYGKVAPVYTVRIHGIDYAYVYQALPAIDQPVQATFGDNVRLLGYRFDAEAAAATDVVTVTLNWQAHTALPEDYLLFAHLLDERGQVVARADVLPGGPTSAWQANRFVTGMFRLPIDTIAEPGRYWLSLGLYDPGSGQRLPLSATAPPGAPDDGPDALRLPITLPATTPIASPP